MYNTAWLFKPLNFFTNTEPKSAKWILFYNSNKISNTFTELPKLLPNKKQLLHFTVTYNLINPQDNSQRMDNRYFISCFSDVYEGIDFVSTDGSASRTRLLYSFDKS